MERISRESGVPVNCLWSAHGNPSYKMRAWNSQLLIYYEKVFPNPKFDAFIEIHNRKLQEAFQQAVGPSKDRARMQELFETNWNFLASWNYGRDEAGAHYLKAKYALMAGWLNMGSTLGYSQRDCLNMARRENDMSLSRLDALPFNSRRSGLKMRALNRSSPLRNVSTCLSSRSIFP
jgi:hypothetical protein